MAKPQEKLDSWFWVKVLVMGFMLIFPFHPFCTLITRSFFSKNVAGFTLESYIRFFTKRYYYDAFGRSPFVSVVITLTILVMGVPIIYVMSRHNVAGKWFIHIFIIMSLMSLPFIGAYSWVTLFGHSGLITSLFADIGIHLPGIYGKMGIIIVFTLKLFPYVYLYTSGVMGNIDSSLEEAAENPRSSKFRGLWIITLPVILPSIAAGTIMVFMTSLTDLRTPTLIGGGYMILPVLVYNEHMSEIGGNAHLTSTLSVITVLCSTTVLLVQRCYVSRKNYVMTTMRLPKEEVLRGPKRFLVIFPVTLITSVGILPQIMVLITSFIKCDFTGFQKRSSLGSYITIFDRLWTSIRNTFVFPTVVTVFIIVLSMLIPYIMVRQKGVAGQLMDLIIMLPFVALGVVLGISLVAAFSKPPVIPIGTALIIIIIFAVRKLPYTVRLGSAFLQQMDPSMEGASISLRVPSVKTFGKVAARLTVPDALFGAILGRTTCINELSPSVMFYGGKTSTTSVAIYTEVVRNSHGAAAVLASVLTVSTVVILLMSPKISKGEVSIVQYVQKPEAFHEDLQASMRKMRRRHMVGFGMGGWRAIIREEFTKESIRELAPAICLKMRGEGVKNQGVVIEYDGRFLSRGVIIWSCEISGNQGIRVWFVNRSSPIPLVMFYVMKHELSYGMMVTANHNSAIYNRIKVFIYGGRDTDERQTAEIEYYLEQAEELYELNEKESGQVPPTSYLEPVRRGMVREINPINEYLDNITSVISVDVIKERNLRIAIGPMYGMSLTTLNTILSVVRCAIETINPRHDILFGGKMPVPTERTLRSLQSYVLDRYYDINIVTGGDTDRLGVIDGQGHYFHANSILVMLYHYPLRYRGWRGPAVYNLATTHVLDKVAKNFGQRYYEVPVGFKHISVEMQETDAIIDGESSGGLTVEGHIHEKDGIHATALLAEMIAISGKKLPKTVADTRKGYGAIHMAEQDYRLIPEERGRIHNTLMEKKKLPEVPFETDHISCMDECKVCFKNGGWAIARFPGAEPLLCIPCETEYEPNTVRVCNLFEEYLGL